MAYETLAGFYNEQTATKIKLLRKGKPGKYTHKIEVMISGKLTDSKTHETEKKAKTQLLKLIESNLSISQLPLPKGRGLNREV